MRGERLRRRASSISRVRLLFEVFGQLLQLGVDVGAEPRVGGGREQQDGREHQTNTLDTASSSTSVRVTRCCGPMSAIFRNDHPTSAVSTIAMPPSTSTGEMASEAENSAFSGNQPRPPPIQ